MIDKPGKGAFYATDLQQQLQQRGITQLVAAGEETVKLYPRLAIHPGRLFC